MNTDNIGAKILSEHKDLRALLEELEQQVQQPADTDAWLGTLRETLSGFVTLCSEHFRLEEQAGLHVQLREESPRLATRLEKLLSDHSRILDALSKLLNDLPTESIGSNADDPWKDRVLSALESVRDHERAENEVMMDAYWDDLGGESG